MKNKYINRAKISETAFRKVVKFFALDLTAAQCAELTGLNRNSVERFYRDGNVYTEIVKDGKKATLQAVIWGKLDISAVIHTDGWGGYDGLVDLGYQKHFRVEHGNNEFSKGKGNHINGIESFWGYAKHRLMKFNGIPKDKFYIYLKETEFRFNMRGKNLYLFLLKEFRNRPLF
ncbi:MAG: IS1595 family transposase [Spirochaetaceae bacterium]|jgi:transposase-like protein|nr:IS1595 family transposase [Spirochaetaceae bacterium]